MEEKLDEKVKNNCHCYIISIFVLIIIFIAIFVNIINNKNNIEKTQENYINSYIEEVGDKRDEVDDFYYWLLKDHYFAIFNKAAVRKEREKIYYYSTHQNEAILEMCKVPPNLYGISMLYDIDRDKGILECEPYDKIYFDENYLDGYDFRKVIIEIGNKKEVYLIGITQDEFVNRVSAKKIEEIDEYGNVKDVRRKRVFDEKNTEYNFNDLCLDGEKEDYAGWYGEYYGDDIGITKHFREKYPENWGRGCIYLTHLRHKIYGKSHREYKRLIENLTRIKLAYLILM